MIRRPPRSTLFPTRRSSDLRTKPVPPRTPAASPLEWTAWPSGCSASTGSSSRAGRAGCAPRSRCDRAHAARPLARSNMPLDPHAKRLLERLAATNPPSARSLTIGARRSALQQLLAFAGLREEVACVENRTLPAAQAPLPVRVYTPTGAPRKPLPALIYFHGGGLVARRLHLHDAVCRSPTQAPARRPHFLGQRPGPPPP